MDVIAHELAEAVNVDQVGIALFNEDRTRLTVVAEHNDAERSPAAIGATIPLEGNLATQRVVANRQILLIDDPATHPLMGSAQGVLEERGVKKLAIMPMIVGNEIVGTVGMDILDESKSFSAEQLRLAETVVYQAASAVQAARLFEQTQSALAETESLYASSSALNQADTYEDVLDVVREYSAIGQAADMLSLSYFNEPWQDGKRPEWIQVLATWQRYGEPVETPVSYSMDQFPTLEEVTRDQPLLLPDIVNDERLNEHTRQLLVDQAQMRSHLFAPMVVGERWVGILGVGGHQPTRYRPSDVRRLMVMVGQAATTVQSLVLFQETRELLQREQRQRRIADSLARAARRLSHALGEAQRRQVIVDEIFDVLQPDVVRLFSWNDENSAFQLLNQHAGPDAALPLDAPVIGSMHTQEARPDLWRVYSQQSSWLNQLETPEDATISAEQYCLPWYIGQDVVGVVEVVACGEGVQIRQEDQAICEGIAQQGATAIQNALLWEQTQEALVFQERLASQLRTVSEVGTAVTTLLDLDLLLQRVVTLTKESFNLYHAHIYVLDDLNNKLVLRAGAGDIGRQMVAERSEISLSDESIVPNAALTDDVVVANDVLSVTNFLPHPLLPETRAEMAVPMIVGQDLVGVLDVQADEENYFSADDILIMQTLAGQIAVAVQNAFLYAEQVQTTDKLREVDQLKSEFLASMSHELRTPLNSIIGFADVLLAGIDGELNDRMEEDVRLIRNSGNHLRELIGDILDMSKIEAGRMELQYELINVDGLVNDVVQSARVSAEEKGLQLKAEIAGDVDTLYADRTRLRQVLVNVVGNAIKFTERGYVHVSVRHIEDQMLFSVEDTGIGIRKEHLPLVFEQFRQIDTSKSGTAGGSGLGMPISKVLVEMHEGRIWVESEHGEGSTFYFTIPNKALPARD